MRGDRIINLTFHGIGEPQRPLEPEEHQVWLDSCQLESVLDLVAGRSDIRITFDDGNASDLEYALPELQRRGLTATFFLIAGRLGAPGFVDESGARALADAGMEIGCHGMRHRPWRRLDEVGLREELVQARRVLEGVIKRPVTDAACPFGSYDSRVLRALRRHGYRRAYTSDPGTAHLQNWIQARNTVRPGDIEGLLAEASTTHGWVGRARLAIKRWR